MQSGPWTKFLDKDTIEKDYTTWSWMGFWIFFFSTEIICNQDSVSAWGRNTFSHKCSHSQKISQVLTVETQIKQIDMAMLFLAEVNICCYCLPRVCFLFLGQQDSFPLRNRISLLNHVLQMSLGSPQFKSSREMVKSRAENNGINFRENFSPILYHMQNVIANFQLHLIWPKSSVRLNWPLPPLEKNIS